MRTGSVINALFCKQEDSLSYFRLLEGLIQRRGVPLALYTDRHPVFKHSSEYQPPAHPPSSAGRWRSWGSN